MRCKVITIEQKHRNNRKLQVQRKGFRPAIRRKRYPIQPKDLFWIGNKMYISNGTHCKGRYVKVETNNKIVDIKIKDITKIYNFGSFVWRY